MSRRRRGLSPEEKDLWLRVAETVAPLRPLRPPPMSLAKPAPIVVLPSTPPSTPTKAPTPPKGAAPPLRMDAKTHTRMKRGKLMPEARIDLHGMTLAEAHPRLAQFVMSAHASGCRLVLVITGKGRGAEGMGPIPRQPGALRRQVPHWLALPPLAPLVLQVTEAHVRHGGAGAFYVYLRRAR